MTTTEATVRAPRILWAQRKDVVFMTIEVVECKDETLEIKEKQVSFKATEGNTNNIYAFDIELFADVDPTQTKQQKTDRHISLVLQKAKTDEPFWSRLQKNKPNPHFIHTDFSKWKEEDEVDEVSGAGADDPMAGFDMSQFAQQFGGAGAGGFGEEEEEEADFYDKKAPTLADLGSSSEDEEEEPSKEDH